MSYTGYATYNITDDKLKLFVEERLSQADYQAARGAKFQYWHGSKCFAAKWSPQAEDFILSLGFEIEDDDTPDDVEARAERFKGYADRSADNAERAESYLAERANTERRKKNGLNALKRETGKAEYWNQRAAASIRHAAFMERPDVIYRRIEGLEKDERKHAKEASMALTNQLARYAVRMQKPDGKIGYFIKPEDKAKAQADAAAWKTYHERWLAHTQMLLAYQRALYTESGGIVADRVKPLVGGAVKHQGEWCEITKVNRVTIQYLAPRCNWKKHWTRKLSELGEIKTPAEWQHYQRWLKGEVPSEKPEAEPQKAEPRRSLYYCHKCGADNKFVNQCGCDPNNMPTRPTETPEDPPAFFPTPPAIAEQMTEAAESQPSLFLMEAGHA